MYKTSQESTERMCYEVRYMSDKKVLIIPLSEFENGIYELV